MAGKRLLDQGVARRKEMMVFIKSYSRKHGVSPTLQEIADAVGLASPNATRNHLQKLQEEGKITMRPRLARSISVVDKSKAS